MREKLIEILRRARYEYRRYIGMKDMEKRMAKTDEEFLAIDDSIVGEIPFCADHLIANGVTVAKDANVPSNVPDTDFGKWIPVAERKPGTIPCGAGTAYSEAVNVLTSGRKVLTAIWNGSYWITDAEFWDAEFEEITHWTPVLLPLPTPPKEG